MQQLSLNIPGAFCSIQVGVYVLNNYIQANLKDSALNDLCCMLFKLDFLFSFFKSCY